MGKRKAAVAAVKKADHHNGQENAAELMKVIIEGTYFSRWRLFWVNLLRGVAFGMGVFIGSTALVVASVWVLGELSDVPLLGGLVDTIRETIDNR